MGKIMDFFHELIRPVMQEKLHPCLNGCLKTWQLMVIMGSKSFMFSDCGKDVLSFRELVYLIVFDGVWHVWGIIRDDP